MVFHLLIRVRVARSFVCGIDTHMSTRCISFRENLRLPGGGSWLALLARLACVSWDLTRFRTYSDVVIVRIYIERE